MYRFVLHLQLLTQHVTVICPVAKQPGHREKWMKINTQTYTHRKNTVHKGDFGQSMHYFHEYLNNDELNVTEIKPSTKQ